MAGIKVALTKYNNWLNKNGYSKEEEAELYDLLLEDIIRHPDYYMKNLHKLTTFRVSWQDYRLKTSPRPYKYVKKTKGL